MLFFAFSPALHGPHPVVSTLLIPSPSLGLHLAGNLRLFQTPGTFPPDLASIQAGSLRECLRASHPAWPPAPRPRRTLASGNKNLSRPQAGGKKVPPKGGRTTESGASDSGARSSSPFRVSPRFLLPGGGRLGSAVGPLLPRAPSEREQGPKLHNQSAPAPILPLIPPHRSPGARGGAAGSPASRGRNRGDTLLRPSPPENPCS